MKRIAWILAAVVLAALALVALVVVLLPRDALKTRVGEQIAAWTGRDVSLIGEPEISFFPKLTVTLKDVEVGGPGGMRDAAFLSMDKLTGTIRLLPLVIGRIEIGSFTMVRPQLHLVRDEKGVRNWTFDSGAAALQLAFAGDVPLGDFTLEDGTVLYEDRQNETTERLDSANLDVEWPSVRQPITITGSGIWRGEEVTLSGNAATPFDFLNGKSSPARMRIDSAPVVAIFDGAASDFNQPRLAGDLTMTTPSLRGFASWLGSPIGAGSTLGPAKLAGTAEFRDRILSVENAELSLDGNVATGALKITAAKAPDITGTLAFPALDLTPYFDGITTSLRTGTDWRQLKFGTDWLRDLSADIRLSADSAQIGALHFGTSAASVMLKDARLEIGVAEAAFGGGSLAGSLAVADIPNMPEANIEAQLHATGIDLAQTAASLGLPANVTGAASIVVDVAGSGHDLEALMHTLGGTGTLDIENGAIPMFGVAEAASGAPVATPAEEPATLTPVQSLRARFSFSNGSASLEDAKVTAPAFAVGATGKIALLDGGLSLSGTISPVDAAPMPFSLEGTLSRPVVRPLALAN